MSFAIDEDSLKMFLPLESTWRRGGGKEKKKMFWDSLGRIAELQRLLPTGSSNDGRSVNEGRSLSLSALREIIDGQKEASL